MGAWIEVNKEYSTNGAISSPINVTLSVFTISSLLNTYVSPPFYGNIFKSKFNIQLYVFSPSVGTYSIIKLREPIIAPPYPLVNSPSNEASFVEM